jgi:hypothetical protein
MRWYWMLLILAVAGLTFSSQEALATARHLIPSAVRPAAPSVLLILAVMAAFTALVLTSRGFGILALVCGVGALWLQNGAWLALEREASRLPLLGTLEVERATAALLRGSHWSFSGDMTWIAALGVVGLLMASLLTLGAKVE